MKPSNYLKELYRNPTDEKYTPGYGVLPIIKYIPESKIIWCPFDTEHSEFVLKFKAAGFEVVYSHICKGQDFFEYEPPQWDVLVSNPPFSRKVDVFDRCLKFGKPFALLMSNYWLNNVAPCRLFLNTELELLMFDKRIQFGEGKNVPFNSSYFVIGYFRSPSYSSRCILQTSRRAVCRKTCLKRTDASLQENKTIIY